MREEARRARTCFGGGAEEGETARCASHPRARSRFPRPARPLGRCVGFLGIVWAGASGREARAGAAGARTSGRDAPAHRPPFCSFFQSAADTRHSWKHFALQQLHGTPDKRHPGPPGAARSQITKLSIESEPVSLMLALSCRSSDMLSGIRFGFFSGIASAQCFGTTRVCPTSRSEESRGVQWEAPSPGFSFFVTKDFFF